MNDSNQNKKSITRRGFLPLLGSGFLLPIVGFGKNSSTLLDSTEEYQTLLKPDGTTVKVKKSVVENSKIVEKNISNQSLLSWLKIKK